MTKRLALWAAIVSLIAVPNGADAGTVTFQHHFGGGNEMIDVFLTPTPGSEFTNFDLIVSFATGSLLDPIRNQPNNVGNFDNVTDGGARVDTWANTPFSALGAGTPSYVFTEYHPGAPPFTPPQDLPTAGSAIDQLNWSVFDIATGDTAQFGPYHIARILTTQNAFFIVEILAFDTITSATGGERFTLVPTQPEPDVAEPASAVLGGLGLLGCAAARRRR